MSRKWLHVAKELASETNKMRPKRIILIRHAESQANEDESILSHVPDPKVGITGRGSSQARDLGEALKDIVQDEKVFFHCSPYMRSKRTLEEIVSRFPKGQYLAREEPRIREQDFGNLQCHDPHLTGNKLAARMSEIKKEREHFGRFFYRFPNGESGADVYDRVSTFLETLHRDFDKPGFGPSLYNNVGLVSHGIFMRLFLMRWYRWSVEEFEALENFRNAEYVIMERQDDGPHRDQYEVIDKESKLRPWKAINMPSWSGQQPYVTLRQSPIYAPWD